MSRTSCSFVSAMGSFFCGQTDLDRLGGQRHMGYPVPLLPGSPGVRDSDFMFQLTNSEELTWEACLSDFGIEMWDKGEQTFSMASSG